MSPLWVLPVGVTAAGMAVLALVARRTAIAADELRVSCRGLTDLGEQVIALQADADAVRRSIEGLRDRRTLRQTADR